MNSVRSTSQSLNYQKFTPSGCKDIGLTKYEFVEKTQFFLFKSVSINNYNFSLKSISAHVEYNQIKLVQFHVLEHI